MKIYILSDIHLEFYVNEHIGIDTFFQSKPNSENDILCLCGDIGDPSEKEYKVFLTDCYNNFSKTFIIYGNHECYGSTLENVEKKIKNVCNDVNKNKPPKVIFLSNDVYELETCDLNVIGSTLWSNIDIEQMYDIIFSMNDFRCIKNWSVSKHVSEYGKSLSFIESQIKLANYKKRKTIIITHHAPSWKCGNPIHEHSSISSAFKNKLDNMILENTNDILLWCYGHDHYSMKFKIGETIIMSNQKGYPDEICQNSTQIQEYIEY